MFKIPITTNFNSIKVQLEHYLVSDDKLYIGNFNSIKVQLEPAQRSWQVKTLLYFNSIKVQLELVLI